MIYHIYYSVKDYLDNTNNYFIKENPTDNDFNTYETLGYLVCGPITIYEIKNSVRYTKRKIK
jgi:hypothetical protein